MRTDSDLWHGIVVAIAALLLLTLPATAQSPADVPGGKDGQSAAAPRTAGGQTKGPDEIGLKERDVARGIQKELERLGCTPGAIDGNWGPRSGRALSEAMRQMGAEAAAPSPDTLSLLEKQTKRVCGCPADQLEVDGKCVSAASRTPDPPASVVRVPPPVAPPSVVRAPTPPPRKAAVPEKKASEPTTSATKASAARPTGSRSPPGVGGTCPGSYMLASGASCTDAAGRTCFAHSGRRVCNY